MKKTITYGELAKRLDAIKLFNKAPELDPEIYDGLENGSLFIQQEDCEWFINDATNKSWCCNTHMFDGTGDYPENQPHPEYCDFSEQDPVEIYQWYLISPSDAEYIKNNTDELIFYSNVLDEYVWGVTHFGTSWDYVDLEFGLEE